MSFVDRARRLLEEMVPRRVSAELFAEMGSAHTVSVRVYTYPFRHIVVDNFLPANDAQSLMHICTSVEERGYRDEMQKDQFFHRSMYDVYIHWPEPTLVPPLGYFFSRSYHSFLKEVFELPLTDDTILAFHHHKENKKDQYIHTDYISGYFERKPLQNGINPWHHNCTHSGQSGEGAVRRARALAAIWYMRDTPWEHTLCGDTGIFSNKAESSLVRTIAPLHNRLLVFEITPTSFHNFMRTHQKKRDSVAQWFYISQEDNKKFFPEMPVSDASVGY